MPTFIGKHVFGRKFTIAKVSIDYKHPSTLLNHSNHLSETISAVGEAELAPGDKPDDEIAYLLAYGRALESLGRKLQKRAWSKISQIDNHNKQKRQAKINKLYTEESQLSSGESSDS